MHKEIGSKSFGSALPASFVKKMSKHNLDQSELQREGARAILMPDSSILAARFIGVNQKFCDLFGYDVKDLRDESFRILQGAQTDTRMLQAGWAEVLSGEDETIPCSLYSKRGNLLSVYLECLLCAEGPQSYVVAVRFHAKLQIPTMRATTVSGAKTLPLLNGRSHRRDNTEDAIQRALQALAPQAPLVVLRRLMKEIVPRARLDAAELEISRLHALLQNRHLGTQEMAAESQGCPTDVDADRSLQGIGPKGENTVPEVESLQARLRAAEQEIKELRRQVAELEQKYAIAKSFIAPASAGDLGAVGASVDPRAGAAAYQRAGAALRSAFPDALASALLRGEPPPPPAAKACVSVFFSDVVGFTSLSAAMDAGRVCDLLGRLFARFDALAEEYGVQKVSPGPCDPWRRWGSKQARDVSLWIKTSQRILSESRGLCDLSRRSRLGAFLCEGKFRKESLSVSLGLR